MPKLQILFTSVIEEPSGFHPVEDEINRILSQVKEEILSVQVETLQEEKEYKLIILTK